MKSSIITRHYNPLGTDSNDKFDRTAKLDCGALQVIH